jgi:hypothetical protein
MSIKIVTEGPIDFDIVSALIPKDKPITVVAATGPSSVISKCRTVLEQTSISTIAVVDADGNSQSDLHEKTRLLIDLLNYNYYSRRLKIIVVSPATESIFLRDMEFVLKKQI